MHYWKSLFLIISDRPEGRSSLEIYIAIAFKSYEALLPPSAADSHFIARKAIYLFTLFLHRDIINMIFTMPIYTP